VGACDFFCTRGTPPTSSAQPPTSCRTGGSPAMAECDGSIPKAEKEKSRFYISFGSLTIKFRVQTAILLHLIYFRFCWYYFTSHGLNIFVLVILEKYPFVCNDEINDLKLLYKK
jgi:hypothetical protein